MMAAGNWMPTLVEMAGAVNLFGKAGEHSPWMKFEELASKNPDVILISPCGFNMDRAAQDLPALTNHAEWNGLKAVRAHRVFMADGNQYFNRPGPRIAESLEILAEITHPELFHFGHEGRAGADCNRGYFFEIRYWLRQPGENRLRATNSPRPAGASTLRSVTIGTPREIVIFGQPVTSNPSNGS